MLGIIKENIEKKISIAVDSLNYSLILDCEIEKSEHIKFGTFVSNVAFAIASKYKKKPIEVAEEIVKALKKIECVEKVVVAKSGLLNFILNDSLFNEYYKEIVAKKDKIGRLKKNLKQNCIEIVSANPNGTLHIGHARIAILSDTISNLIEFCGEKVFRPYLINDCGQQMKEVVKCVWFKQKFLLYGINNEEIKDMKYNNSDTEKCAVYMLKEKGSLWSFDEILEESKHYEDIKKFVVDFFLSEINNSLSSIKTTVDSWEWESKIVTDSSLKHVFEKIKDFLYVKDHAVWFKTSHFFKDSKDDVIIKSSGEHTYFAQDLVYHWHKLLLLNTEGKVINVFACDHDWHIKRLQAFFMAIGIPQKKLIFKTIQLARLINNEKKEVMSKRNNNVLSITELFEYMSYEEIRWFFISKDCSSELDIDVSKLKDKTYNNSIFYILYAYSRIEQILAKEIQADLYIRDIEFDKLSSEREKEMINLILNFDEVIKSSFKHLKPSLICAYLYQLAKEFHSFYEESEIIKNKCKDTRIQRLALCFAIKCIIASALSIFKIEPKSKI